MNSLCNGKTTTHTIKQTTHSSCSDFWSAHRAKLHKPIKEIKIYEMLIRWEKAEPNGEGIWNRI